MKSELELILKNSQNLMQQGKLARAETFLLDRYEKWADHPIINFLLGQVFSRKGDINKSLHYLETGYQYGKHISSIVVLFAEQLQANNESDQARAVLKLALINSPCDKELLQSFANLCLADQKPLDSLRINSRILLLFPLNEKAHANIAEAYAAVDNHEKSLVHINIAIEREPSSQLRLNRSITLLTLGHYEEGWADYESRLSHDIISSPKRLIRVPRWNREALRNKTILVCSEQGVGDELYFSAYLPKLKGIAGRIILETDPRLVGIFKESLPDLSIFPYSRRLANQRPVYNYGWLPKSLYPDFYIDLASLPYFFSEKKIKKMNTTGYLRIAKSARDHWKKKLFSLSDGRPVIGLFWRSGLNTAARQHWYPPLHFWEPVLTIPDVCFVSLQYDDDADDIKFVKDEFGVSLIKLCDVDLKNDFRQLGAICSALVGVVAPSTTTAHLAAAVGTRTIIVDKTRTWSPTINGFDAFLPCIQRIHPPNSGDWQWVFDDTRRQIDHWLLAR